MTALGLERSSIPLHVDSLLFAQKRGYRLEGNAEENVLTVGDASLDTSTVVGSGGKG